MTDCVPTRLTHFFTVYTCTWTHDSWWLDLQEWRNSSVSQERINPLTFIDWLPNSIGLCLGNPFSSSWVFLFMTTESSVVKHPDPGLVADQSWWDNICVNAWWQSAASTFSPGVKYHVRNSVTRTWKRVHCVHVYLSVWWVGIGVVGGGVVEGAVGGSSCRSNAAYGNKRLSRGFKVSISGVCME